MPINPYFNQTDFASEQKLLADLLEESIKIYGHDGYYIPRENVNLDHLFGEDPLQYYANAQPIELYVKDFRDFAGQSDLMSKFGLQIQNQMTFSVSQRRFYQVWPSMKRPRENDIIYFEFQRPYVDSVSPDRYIFQINYVHQHEWFYALGKLYTFELRCEAMTYSHERIMTGNTDVDAVAQERAYAQMLVMGSGSGTYEYEEFVYQGRSLVDSTASGTVIHWNANTATLEVQAINGEFLQGLPVVGVSSNAVHTPGPAPTTSPTVKDPISDNDQFAIESPRIIIDRGGNPRFNN
jgi:Virus neck protein